MNIVSIIKDETQQHLHNIAVIERNRQISYAELFIATDAVAKELLRCGVCPAQRVALMCDDSVDYIIISLAVLSVQAVLVPIALSLSREEVDAVLEAIDVNFFLFEENVKFLDNVQKAFFQGAFEKQFYLYVRTAREQLPSGYYMLNPAFIRFSSGTTGPHKGVVLSHQSIKDRTEAADKVLKMNPDDIVLWVLSMSYHFVVTILLFLRRSATILLCSGNFPESLIHGIVSHQGTFIYASPFHYTMLTNADECTPQLLSRIRLAISTAMNLSLPVAQGFFKKFGFELSVAYGIIEIGLPCINCSGDAMKRGSVGTVLPDYEVKIVHPDAEGIGNVYIRGKGMFDAYFSPWQSRQEILPDGWFNSGDLGKFDHDGFLYLVGRKKNVINFAGMKIFPYEVEAVLNQHPDIKESLVYGVAHPHYGELPCAKIVLRDQTRTDIDQTGLRRFCYKHLSSYKVPKEYHCVSCLDKTESGKLKRW